MHESLTRFYYQTMRWYHPKIRMSFIPWSVLSRNRTKTQPLFWPTKIEASIFVFLARKKNGMKHHFHIWSGRVLSKFTGSNSQGFISPDCLELFWTISKNKRNDPVKSERFCGTVLIFQSFALYLSIWAPFLFKAWLPSFFLSNHCQTIIIKSKFLRFLWKPLSATVRLATPMMIMIQRKLDHEVFHILVVKKVLMKRSQMTFLLKSLMLLGLTQLKSDEPEILEVFLKHSHYWSSEIMAENMRVRTYKNNFWFYVKIFVSLSTSSNVMLSFYFFFEF